MTYLTFSGEPCPVECERVTITMKKINDPDPNALAGTHHLDGTLVWPVAID